MGLQRWSFKFVQHIANATCVSQLPAGSSSSCPLYLLHLLNLNFMIRMPNMCCMLVLELRADQCFVCNFLCMLRCQCQKFVFRYYNGDSNFNLKHLINQTFIKTNKHIIVSHGVLVALVGT